MERKARSAHRWLRPTVAILILVLLGLPAVAYAWDLLAARQAVADYPPRGVFVQVDGSPMHVICQGSGDRTIVMQAGIAGGALDWLPLMDELAGSYRVCAFDRFGPDWSDPAPLPRTFASAADEWHAALQAAGIERPIVVGHSLGGAIAQVYAGRYEVDGLILIEGLSADVAEPVVQRLGAYERLSLLAKLGLLRPLGTLFADRSYPDALRQEMVSLRSRSASILNVSAEGALAAETAVDELHAAEGEISAPLLIVAAGASELPERTQFLQALRNLAARHPDSTFVMVADAGHYVMASHPAQVAEIMGQWILEAVPSR